MKLRIGHDLLFGKTTLKRLTVIDVEESYGGELYYMTLNEEGDVKNITIDSLEDLFAHLDNGIHKPETQDTRDSFTVEGDDNQKHTNKFKVGTKVKFTTKHQNATLEVVGYIIRNFWPNYYMVSELGVSVANRHWKVGHSKVSEF